LPLYGLKSETVLIEGAEPFVLENIDFDKIFVDVMIAENENSYCTKENCTSRDRARSIMKQHGYLLYSSVITRSDLFVNPKSEFVTSSTLLAKYQPDA
jgi:hypothetical protein